jgi:hypothetical protein
VTVKQRLMNKDGALIRRTESKAVYEWRGAGEIPVWRWDSTEEHFSPTTGESLGSGERSGELPHITPDWAVNGSNNVLLGKPRRYELPGGIIVEWEYHGCIVSRLG